MAWWRHSTEPSPNFPPSPASRSPLTRSSLGSSRSRLSEPDALAASAPRIVLFLEAGRRSACCGEEMGQRLAQHFAVDLVPAVEASETHTIAEPGELGHECAGGTPEWLDRIAAPMGDEQRLSALCARRQE